MAYSLHWPQTNIWEAKETNVFQRTKAVGIPEKLTRMIKRTLSNKWNRVGINGNKSDNFEI